VLFLIMLFGEINRALGRYLLYLALVLCVPLAVAIGYEFFLDPKLHPQPHSSNAFLYTICITLSLSSLLLFLGRHAKKTLPRKECIFLVVSIWFITAAIGSLPFVFTKTLENPLDAYFESMSSLTTTGATVIYPKAYDAQTGAEIPVIIETSSEPKTTYSFYGTVAPTIDPTSGAVLHTGIEAVGKALLFWRSFLQWLGGMGIVVLFIAVLPALAMGGKFLFEAEISGPNKESMTPRIKQTASMLWKIYLGLTATQVILLMLTNANIPFFDAVTLSFSTISTGGFSVRNEGLAAYNSLSTDWIVMVFMILGGLNFVLYAHVLRGKIYKLYEPELRVYLLTLLCSSLLMSWSLLHTPKILFNGQEGTFSFWEALRYGSFEAISSQSSTGYAIASYDFWPWTSQAILFTLMFVGGMSGSTTGGIKIARQYISFRVIAHKIESIFRPDTVRCLKVGQKEVTDKTAITVLTYFLIIILFVVLGTFLLIVNKVDPKSALSVISSVTNNGGLAFGVAGSTSSYAFLPPFSKVISILWMLLGRLEFFALLVLLVPAFWKSK
jgi:trk system potassium uptake protein TrkH